MMYCMNACLIFMLFFAPFARADVEFDASAEPLFEFVQEANPQPDEVTGDPTPFPCMQRNDCYLMYYTGIERDVIPVKDVQRIRLLGKGLRGKRSKQLLGIACVGENDSCEIMRYIYQVNPQEVYFLGPKFKLNPRYEGGNKKALKKAVHALYDEASNSGQRGLKIFAGALFAAFGSVFLFHVTWPAVTLFMIAVAKGASGGEKFMGISSFPAFDVSNNLRNATGTDAATYMQNQNGWNWEDKPGKVSEKTFGQMIRQFQYMNGYFSGSSEAIKSGAIYIVR